MFNLLKICFEALPWLVIALFGGLALYRKKGSQPLMLQSGGAALLFMLPLARWLLVDVLLHLVFKAGNTVINGANSIFGFLLFLSLAAFALGYCLERLARTKPAQVTATPA